VPSRAPRAAATFRTLDGLATHVTFVFLGESDEARLVTQPPALGETVTSRDGKRWVVCALDSDGLVCQVLCRPTRDEPIET